MKIRALLHGGLAGLLLLAQAPLARAQGGVSSGGREGAPVVVIPSDFAVTVKQASLYAGSLVAPATIVFEAYSLATFQGADIALEDEALISCVWTFGDPSSGTWSTGTLPGRSRNSQPGGFVAAHLFGAAGTYTISAACHFAGQVAVDTFDVTILDPNTQYPTASTVCISNTGFSGCPAGATQLPRSTISSADLAVDQRTCLKGGDTYTTTALSFPAGGSGTDPAWLGVCPGFGTGKATIQAGDADVAFSNSVGPRIVDVVIENASPALGDQMTSFSLTADSEDINFVRVECKSYPKCVYGAVGNNAGQMTDGLYLVDFVYRPQAKGTLSGGSAACNYFNADHGVIMGWQTASDCGMQTGDEMLIRSQRSAESVYAFNDFGPPNDPGGNKPSIALRASNSSPAVGGAGITGQGTPSPPFDSHHYLFGWNDVDLKNVATAGDVTFESQNATEYEHHSAVQVIGSMTRRSVAGGIPTAQSFLFENVNGALLTGNFCDLTNNSTQCSDTSQSGPAPGSANVRAIGNAVYDPNGDPGTSGYFGGGAMTARVGNIAWCNGTVTNCAFGGSNSADSVMRRVGVDTYPFTTNPPNVADPFPDLRLGAGDAARNTYSPLVSGGALTAEGGVRVDPSDPGPMDRDL